MNDLLILADYLLVLAILLVGIFLLSDENKTVSYLFAIGAIAYDLIGDLILNNFLYYYGAALTDLIIIYFLAKLSSQTKLTIKMQEICKAFIIVNATGYIIYEMELTPEIYTLLCTTLYAWALYIVLTDKDNHVGINSRLDFTFYSVFTNYSKSPHLLPSIKKEARN